MHFDFSDFGPRTKSKKKLVRGPDSPWTALKKNGASKYLKMAKEALKKMPQNALKICLKNMPQGGVRMYPQKKCVKPSHKRRAWMARSTAASAGC